MAFTARFNVMGIDDSTDKVGVLRGKDDFVEWSSRLRRAAIIQRLHSHIFEDMTEALAWPTWLEWGEFIVDTPTGRSLGPMEGFTDLHRTTIEFQRRFDDWKQADKTDLKAQTFLLQCVHDDLLEELADMETAHEMWLHLQEKFSTTEANK